LTAETVDGRAVGQASVKILNSAPVITSVIAPTSVYEGDPIEIKFSATDADNDALRYNIYKEGNSVANSNSFIWNTKSGEKGTYNFVLSVTDGEVQTSTPLQIVVKSKKKEDTNQENQDYKILRLMKDIEITPFANYLMVRNKGAKITGLKISITFLKTGAEEHSKVDLSKNEVTYIPISTKLEGGKVYAAKISVKAHSIDDYGYIIIRK